MATPTSLLELPANVIGTKTNFACCANGTAGLYPVNFTESPLIDAVTVGRITSFAPDSASAIVTIVSPVAIPGNNLLCCSGEPKSVIASALTPVVQSGTGAT